MSLLRFRSDPFGRASGDPSLRLPSRRIGVGMNPKPPLCKGSYISATILIEGLFFRQKQVPPPCGCGWINSKCKILTVTAYWGLFKICILLPQTLLLTISSFATILFWFFSLLREKNKRKVTAPIRRTPGLLPSPRESLRESSTHSIRKIRGGKGVSRPFSAFGRASHRSLRASFRLF